MLGRQSLGEGLRAVGGSVLGDDDLELSATRPHAFEEVGDRLLEVRLLVVGGQHQRDHRAKLEEGGATTTLARAAMASLDTIFKAYDIRGVVPDEFDAQTAGLIGSSFAAFAGA